MLTLRNALLLSFFVGACLPSAAVADEATSGRRANAFFAFDNGTGRRHLSPDEQAKMLKDLGYAGIRWSGTEQIPEMLEALDAQGLKMFSIYVVANVDPNRPPYDPKIKAVIEQLKGRDTVLWLHVNGPKPSSTESDEQAVAVFREIADMADKSGLRVALYPHVGTYVARAEDAVRLAKKVDHKNLGVCFNLCHFLKLDDEKNIEQRLRETLPHLFAVNINGADGGATQAMNWDRLIQTLDRGSFDVARVLAAIKQLGYAGPIGLQCYGIPGDCRENLARSMSGWRKLSRHLVDY